MKPAIFMTGCVPVRALFWNPWDSKVAMRFQTNGDFVPNAGSESEPVACGPTRRLVDLQDGVYGSEITMVSCFSWDTKGKLSGSEY